MKVEFEEIQSNSAWDDLVTRWRSSTVFHQSGWLEAAAKFSKQSLVRLVGRADGEEVLAMPIFLAKAGPLRTVLSPPPKLAIQHLGPFLRDDIQDSPSNESLRLEVLGESLHAITQRFGPALLYVRTAPRFTDLRPFRWQGCTVEVLYTYVKRLPERIEDLLPTFHRRVRSYLRQTSGPVSVRLGGRDLCAEVHRFVAGRFSQQGQVFGPTRDYFAALYDTLGPSKFQPIGAYTDSGLEAAAIVTIHGRRASFWQHASATSSSRLPLTDHLIWSSMNFAAQRGCNEFEMVGANTPRLVTFKTKFTPELEQFFEISRASATGRIARALYRRLRG